VQATARVQPPATTTTAGEATLEATPIGDFVAAVGELRGSSAEQRAAHLERLGSTPLATRALIARIDGRTVACGQAALERSLCGIYDMVTAADAQGRGLATLIVSELLAWGWQHGASHAYLQVNDDNVPALAVYRKFGFASVYTYHYRARADECR
jgi:GNAT superfamily N-acetyltransferase